MDISYQRILDMAKQAGLKGRDEPWLSPAELEFAGRIIKECADIADINAHQYESPGNYIKNHFGVK